MDSSHIWRAYNRELLNLAVGGSFDKQKQLFTVLGVSTPIDLVDTDAQVINFNIYSKGMIVPAWSSAWSPKSDIVSAYPIFLNTVLAGHPNLQEGKKQDLGRKLAGALTNLASINPSLPSSTQVPGHHTLQPGNHHIFSTRPVGMQTTLFVRNLDQQQDGKVTVKPILLEPSFDVELGPEESKQHDISYAGALVEVRNTGFGQVETWTDYQLFEQFKEFADLLDVDWNKVNDADAQALTSALDAYTAAVSPNPNSFNMAAFIAGQTRRVPVFTLDSSFEATFQEWKNNPTDKSRITISQESQTISLKDMGIPSTADDTMNTSFLQDSQMANSVAEIEISFTGLGAFGIQPGRWFQLGTINTYRDGLPSENRLFGPGGSLSLLPNRLLLGFDPTLTLTLNQRAYNEQRQATERLHSQSIGPFDLKVGQNADIHFDDDHHKIIYHASGSLPSLLGVICTKL